MIFVIMNAAKMPAIAAVACANELKNQFQSIPDRSSHVNSIRITVRYAPRHKEINGSWLVLIAIDYPPTGPNHYRRRRCLTYYEELLAARVRKTSEIKVFTLKGRIVYYTSIQIRNNSAGRRVYENG